MLSDNLWVGEHTRPERVQESSRFSGMADSRDGNEADVSSNGVRSDEDGASLGEDSGSNASGGSSCSNASSLLREWGHEREAEIEASREEQLIEEWTAAWQEVRADAVCVLTVGSWFADDEGCISALFLLE